MGDGSDFIVGFIKHKESVWAIQTLSYSYFLRVNPSTNLVEE